MNPRSAVTLRHVADEAGVSVTTVSRILNGRETGVPIREETRQRILAAATELGYRPNLMARALRGSRSSLLGVIVRDIADPFHVQVLRGLNAVARDREYRLFLGYVDYRPDEAAIYASMFEQSHADGIVIIGDIQGGDATLDALADHHRYVLGVTDRIARRRVPGIYVDNTTGTRLAMDHLWGLGHRSIVCVADERIAEGPLRGQLYEAYMRDHGVSDAARVYYTTQPDPEPSYRLGRQLLATLDRPGGPTAIYAASDTLAIGLLQAAFQLGIAVPQRLSIVGFDDIDVAPFTIPPLTTIDQSGEEMGRIAAELILGMVEADRIAADVDDVIVQPKLVVRQSTAPAPAAPAPAA
jgi:DNA-binding LacI/PurR family transcriptional regulator